MPPSFVMTTGELEKLLLYCIFCRPFNKEDREEIDKAIAREMLLSEFEPEDKIRPFALFCEALADKRITPDVTNFRKLIFADINLERCSLSELLRFDINLISAKEFLLLTRPGIHYAVLDPVVLRWMRKNVNRRAPYKTPKTEAKYVEWELAFIREAKKREVSCLDLYLEIHGQIEKKVEKTLDSSEEADKLNP